MHADASDVRARAHKAHVEGFTKARGGNRAGGELPAAPSCAFPLTTTRQRATSCACEFTSLLNPRGFTRASRGCRGLTRARAQPSTPKEAAKLFHVFQHGGACNSPDVYIRVCGCVKLEHPSLQNSILIVTVYSSRDFFLNFDMPCGGRNCNR